MSSQVMSEVKILKALKHVSIVLTRFSGLCLFSSTLFCVKSQLSVLDSELMISYCQKTGYNGFTH